LQQQLQQLHISGASAQQQQQQQQQAAHTRAAGIQHADVAAGANGDAAVRGDEVVTLNVGGRLFSCQRRTLCLVEESVLALMFG
jgi:hypothetical protein